jgi:hypothetical protein
MAQGQGDLRIVSGPAQPQDRRASVVAVLYTVLPNRQCLDMPQHLNPQQGHASPSTCGPCWLIRRLVTVVCSFATGVT